MSITADDPQRRVAFGATVAAVAGAFRFAAPAIGLAWAAHLVVHGVPVLLDVNHVTIPQLPFGPRGWSAGLPVAAAMALVSGLLIRRLLNPGAGLRFDGPLFAYAGLMVAAYVIDTLVGYAILPDVRGKSSIELGLLMMMSGGVRIVLALVFAYVALWPVAILTGDAIDLGAAAARMRQAFLTYVILSFLMEVPAALYLPIRMAVTRGLTMQLADRLVILVIGGVVTTLGSVLLAQVYARRVRAGDLGSGPQETIGDVFA